MKGNKIIATLIVIAMLLSTLVVLKQLNVVNEASAQPGVAAWGDATTDLVYDVTYTSVHVNSSLWSGTGPFYLYYPAYVSDTSGVATEFRWDGAYEVGSYLVRVNDKADEALIYTGGQSISFNRSGMWIFDEDTTHTAADPLSYAGFIWVNTSTNYSIESIADFTYGSSGSITITVDTGSDAGCMIALLNPDNQTVYNKWRSNGISESIDIDTTNFSIAGDYTVKAYRDKDAQQRVYYYAEEDGNAYDNRYGSDYSGMFPTPATYSYVNVGPWDPPEVNASDMTFTVNTGKPNIVLTNTSLFWGFEAHIDINVTDYDGIGLNDTSAVKLKFGSKFINMTMFPYVINKNLGNYSIDIPRWDVDNTVWHALALALNSSNVNGTWRVVFAQDKNDDGTDEWNNSASFIVKSANPPVQLVIVSPEDKEVNVPAYTSGDNAAPTVEILFDIFGTSISNVQGRAYYGDNNPPEDYKNITISGDILYPVDAMYLGPNGRWKADVTPTKPDGTITITIDWPGDDNGTASQTIDIIDGTYVTPAIASFTVGSDFNLTVTVKDTDQAAVKNAQVWLIWEDTHTQFNSTNGTNEAGNGLNGEYTFWIRHKDSTTPTYAPANITIAGRWYEGFWGYAKVVMARNHNMRINVTPTTAYAGDPQTYDITVKLSDGGNPSKTGLIVTLYSSSDENVYEKTGDYSITDEEIILSGGTYRFYAHNATHDSEGYNATIIVTNYTVASTPSTLAWKIDTEVNMTFQLTPARDGTLTLNNMSALPNASAVGQINQVSISNGTGTLEGVNATTLGNVTFDFTPDGGAEEHADGLLRVTTATATPNPAKIYIGEATDVTITVTHPATGTPLENVRIGLDHGMTLNETILAKLPDDVYTDSAGKAYFSIVADASGEITIYIENETDPNNEFVITAGARVPMTISITPAVDEGKTFTAEAKSNDVLITSTTVTFTFDGQTWPTTTGVATITAPTVSTSMAYPITATAEGYITATASIMVLNVPKLVIAVSPNVKTGQTFTVTIADDTGTAVIGATITFEGKTYTSGAGGSASITAPSKEGSYPITATFAGYEPVSGTVVVTPGGIPGFELLTLIAAIGVAFLLLRRRQK